MNFSSDNVSPICPEILAAIGEASDPALPYGADAASQQLDHAFSDLFGKEVAVVPVATGTAANLVGLSALVSPFGGVACHHQAHINRTESTGVAFYGNGAKLMTMDGPSAKLEPETLDAFLIRENTHGMHSVDPECVAITQATEFGTIYDVDEVQAIGRVARAHGMKFFMDGARFANAIAALGCHPADITWKAGLDVLSFGATKNGAMAVDAIILFDPSLRARVEKARKRGGHLFSKHRYLAAQLLAYVKDDLWLRNARHANGAAKTLCDMLVSHGATLAHAADGNEIFANIPAELAQKMRDAGALFYPWPSLGADIYRFVTAWNTDIAQISELNDRIARN